MNDFEAVVVDYIAADRAVFVNPQCLIQLAPCENPDVGGPHWYCDAVAVDFRTGTTFLCETTFAATLGALVRRLRLWREHWHDVRTALARDSHVPPDFALRVWLFVPEACLPRLLAQLHLMDFPQFQPRITPLEMVQPWRYRSWDRIGEGLKPAIIPAAMQA